MTADNRCGRGRPTSRQRCDLHKCTSVKPPGNSTIVSFYIHSRDLLPTWRQILFRFGYFNSEKKRGLIFLQFIPPFLKFCVIVNQLQAKDFPAGLNIYKSQQMFILKMIYYRTGLNCAGGEVYFHRRINTHMLLLRTSGCRMDMGDVSLKAFFQKPYCISC